MSRVVLVAEDQAPLVAQPYYAGGDPGPIARALAHVPEVMESALPFIGASLAPAAVDFRTKELIIVRASAIQECRYCTLTHSAIALKAGVSPEEVRRLREAPAGDAGADFAPAEAALLDWTDLVATGGAEIGQGAYDSIREHFSEAEIVDITMTVCSTLMLNRFCTALELPVAAATTQALEEAGLT